MVNYELQISLDEGKVAQQMMGERNLKAFTFEYKGEKFKAWGKDKATAKLFFNVALEEM